MSDGTMYVCYQRISKEYKCLLFLVTFFTHSICSAQCAQNYGGPIMCVSSVRLEVSTGKCVMLMAE
jgi:hypothetical protein